MPRRISDYPDAFAGWNYVSSFGSIISVVATGLFLHLTYLQLTVGKAVSRYPWTTPQFFSDLLQTLLNRSYTSLEWALTSPPAPHAFVSLPLQSKLSLGLKVAIFPITIAMLMLFLYKLPFKFLSTCLGWIFLFPIVGVKLIIITIIIKKLYSEQDIHRKDFIFPLIMYLFIQTVLHIIGTYIQSDDILVILRTLESYSFLIIMGYVSIKELVHDVFITVFSKDLVLHINDSNGPQYPFLNKHKPYKEMLQRTWMREDVKSNSILYNKVSEEYAYRNNKDQRFSMGAFGTELWRRSGESKVVHESRLIGRMAEIATFRTEGKVLKAYPTLCLNRVAFSRLYSRLEGAPAEDGLPAIESTHFKYEFIVLHSISINRFLADPNGYDGTHQPFAGYVATKLVHISTTGKAPSLFSGLLGNLERAYCLEQYNIFKNENPHLASKVNGGLSGTYFQNWLANRP